MTLRLHPVVANLALLGASVVVALGATEIDDQRNHYGPGIGWVVLADPEGNEFCAFAP